MSKISTRDLKKMIRNSRRFRLTYILGYIFIAIGGVVRRLVGFHGYMSTL